MKDPEAPRTGIIECEKGSASFYMNDFSFCFMNNTIKRITKRSGEIYSAANLLFALKKQGNLFFNRRKRNCKGKNLAGTCTSQICGFDCRYIKIGTTNIRSGQIFQKLWK